MIEIVKNRRTIRKYLQKDISSDLLNDLLETSFRASTMGGMQLYSVIVTRDTEMKEKLSPAHFQPANGQRGTGSAYILRRFSPFY